MNKDFAFAELSLITQADGLCSMEERKDGIRNGPIEGKRRRRREKKYISTMQRAAFLSCLLYSAGAIYSSRPHSASLPTRLTIQ